MLFLDDAELDQLYPCRLLVSETGVIERVGPAIARMFGRDVTGSRFEDLFTVATGRRGDGGAGLALRTPVMLATRQATPLHLRGAVIASGGGRMHLLLGGAPDGNPATADRYRYSDFAPTDGAIDFILATQLREAANEDARRLMERLVEARAAEAASQARTRFFASMSHELRTPLNAIIGFTEIVIEDLAQAGLDGSTDDLARVLRAATHLLDLVNDVLDLAKIEAGKMTINAEPVDFGEIARDTVATLEPIVRKGGNKMLVRVDPDVGAGVSDGRRVRQCLINLIGNAAKFTANGEVRITAESARDNNGQDVVVFTVADTGIGMSPAEIGRLFKPFVQASMETSTVYGGTGLGLAITHESVRLLGGRIAVESAPGRGSTFTMHIPVTAPAATEVRDRPRMSA